MSQSPDPRFRAPVRARPVRADGSRFGYAEIMSRKCTVQAHIYRGNFRATNFAHESHLLEVISLHSVIELGPPKIGIYNSQAIGAVQWMQRMLQTRQAALTERRKSPTRQNAVFILSY